MASGYSDLSEISRNQRAYGLHNQPAKINLLNERPRRESVIEQQLTTIIERPSVSNQQQQQQQHLYQQATSSNYQQQPVQGSHRFNLIQSDEPQQAITKHQTMITTTTRMSPQTRGAQQLQQKQNPLMAYSELVSDLAQKEAKLRRELAYTNQHLANPWARPPQIREPRREPARAGVVAASSNREHSHQWVKEIPVSPTSRSVSRASSTRSTAESDLMEKTDRLLKDVEELEKKQLKTQQILIEGDATRTSPIGLQAANSGSLHTAIIKVPATEPDNKSPLPFAFDNFSTLGVRGNIASFGAAEPESPYPPIFPVVKRTPSPRR